MNSVFVLFDGTKPIRAYPDRDGAHDDPAWERRSNEPGVSADRIAEVPVHGFEDE